ncbi:MAG TPA: SigE family RNA polymerase sigma factor [Mycobacteriales bacterium]|nr:SigE family RNA polymerase sigma factor [Mycobacteriales bacterium]
MDADAEDDFRDFVLARTPALLGTAYALTGDRGLAEDLVQTALLKTYRHWRTVRDAEHPEAYVRRMLVNQQLSWWRRRRVAESGRPLPDRAGPDRPSAVEDRDELWRALRQLPPRTRAVLVLRYWEDLPEAEVADILGCSVGSVKSQASRGLHRLRGVLVAGRASGDREGIKP